MKSFDAQLMTTADAELSQKQHRASPPLPQSTREVNDQDVQDDEEENVKKKKKQQNLKQATGGDDGDGVPKGDDDVQKETSSVSSESKQNNDRKELDNNEKVGSYCLGN